MSIASAPDTPKGTPQPTNNARLEVRGKFLFRGSEKIYIRGVTYGTFRPDANNNEFHDHELVERDFTAMAENGFNAVRTYTIPPRWLLDIAARHDLLVMVGVPWEQHIAFLDDPKRRRSIEDRVRQAVRSCARHPAVLCFTIGNEIPAPIVRWYGYRRIEHFLRRLYQVAKVEDATALVTYVNYPSTEYLQLPFLDFVCFNVYLEAETQLQAYLARLHNLAGDKPLIMAEIGLDTRRNGEEKQAHVLEWQLRTVLGSGCAGAFIFAWTDKWYRGGYDIEDWDFGLTDRERRPKPALDVVRKTFVEALRPREDVPKISVIVCSHNGARTLPETCTALARLEYPNYEVIVVDDGSTDQTASIALGYAFRVISTQNQGLSSARNTGLAAATGEIVAYLDDDAYPDPHWLLYLSRAFERTQHVGICGPNVAPQGDGLIADCVACAPGSPIHVLISDQVAEHIPGCNMAFRKACLEAIGGFDPQFRVAGDDVDICWRLQQRGWTLGFAPGALVWHHRRNSVRAYWRQQKGYGKAEVLLQRKWPGKYNAAGQAMWSGQLYGSGLIRGPGNGRRKVFYGLWGSAPFQLLYPSASGGLLSLLLTPECYLVLFMLAVLALLGLSWTPLLLATPLLVLVIVLLLLQACLSASHASFVNAPLSRSQRAVRYCLVTLLYLTQPVVRLYERLRYGLIPWPARLRTQGLADSWRQAFLVWSEHWHAPEEWLRSIELILQADGSATARGGAFDRWDLQERAGLLGGTRLRMVIEEHGGGKQLARFGLHPYCSAFAISCTTALFIIASRAALDGAWLAAAVTAILALLLAARTLFECAASTDSFLHALEQFSPSAAGAGHDRPAHDAPIILREPVLAPITSAKNAVEEVVSHE